MANIKPIVLDRKIIPFVELTTAEILHVAIAGVMRNVQNIKRGSRDTNNPDGLPLDDWQLHIEGALSEYAFACLLGKPWGIGERGDPDIGQTLQIRSTKYNSGRLRITQRDTPDHLFILAVGRSGRYRFPGCIIARDAMRPEYYTAPQANRPPAYFVPQPDLTLLDQKFPQVEQWKTQNSTH